MAGRERVPEGVRDPLPELVVEVDARAEHDEEQEFVVLLEVDDEAVEHLVDLLHDGVDLARAEADAAAVERGVGPPVMIALPRSVSRTQSPNRHTPG
jgi:hypothetical protein